jgi:hypothetical protein
MFALYDGRGISVHQVLKCHAQSLLCHTVFPGDEGQFPVPVHLLALSKLLQQPEPMEVVQL